MPVNIDSNSFEEMLFGFPSPQDSVGDVWDYDSQDEEMLDAPFDDELTSWNLPDSPMLSPPLNDQHSDELLLDDGKDAGVDATQFHRQEEPSPAAKDRYGCSHSASSCCLIWTGIGS